MLCSSESVYESSGCDLVKLDNTYPRPLNGIYTCAASILPSGENTTSNNLLSRDMSSCCPVSTSHSLSAQASILPSGENDIESVEPLSTWNVSIFCPVSTFHSLRVPGKWKPDPEASFVPSGENATTVTSSLCPASSVSSSNVSAS